MTGYIYIDGKKVGVIASAATPHFYNTVFKGENYLAQVQGLKVEDETGTVSAAVIDENYDFLCKAAYIMICQHAAQSDRELMRSLSYDGYLSWLEGLSTLAIYRAMPGILNALFSNMKTGSIPKKKRGRRKGNTRAAYTS